MIAERHHYVPQFYLPGFVKDPKQPRLFAIDTFKRKAFHPSPKDVAVELNFHTIDISGKPSDIVETKLAEMESEFAPAIARIRDRQSLANDEDRHLLLTFMAFLSIRNPRMRSRISKPLGDLALRTMQMQAGDSKAWALKMEQAKRDGTIEQDADTDERRKLLLQGDAFTVGLSVAGHLHFEFGAVAARLTHHSRPHNYALGRVPGRVPLKAALQREPHEARQAHRQASLCALMNSRESLRLVTFFVS